MKRRHPPRWLEQILLCLLPDRDKQTVSGDLLEEFEERARARGNQLGARLWYVRQIVSFVPAWLGTRGILRTLLLSACTFTALAGLWLGFMAFLLNHRGHLQVEAVSAFIVSQALLTLAALRFPATRTLLRLSAIGCIALLWIAGTALKGIIDGSNFEGYLLLIAIGLIFQSVFTVATLIAARQRPQVEP